MEELPEADLERVAAGKELGARRSRRASLWDSSPAARSLLLPAQEARRTVATGAGGVTCVGGVCRRA